MNATIDFLDGIEERFMLHPRVVHQKCNDDASTTLTDPSMVTTMTSATPVKCKVGMTTRSMKMKENLMSPSMPIMTTLTTSKMASTSSCNKTSNIRLFNAIFPGDGGGGDSFNLTDLEISEANQKIIN